MHFSPTVIFFVNCVFSPLTFISQFWNFGSI